MDELIKALKALSDADRAKFGTTLQNEAPALYQSVFQAGHDVGYGKKGAELVAAQGKVTELEGRITALDTEVTKLKSNPDTAALHKQYAEERDKLVKEHAEAMSKVTGQIVSEKTSRYVTQLQQLLTAGEKRLQGDYATVLTEKADVRGRIKVNADGSWQVLQKGKDIPFAAATPEAAIAMLADELKSEAPAAFVLAGTDSGGGVTNGSSPLPPAGGSVFDKIRAEVKTASEKKTMGDIKPHGAFASLGQPLA